MDAILLKVIQESPYIAALLILMLMNYRSMERITKDFTDTIRERDKIFMDMSQAQLKKLEEIHVLQASHAEEMTQGMELMKRTVGKHIPKRRKTDAK